MEDYDPHTKVTPENLAELTAQHFVHDARFQADVVEQNKAIHDRMDTLATKDDVTTLAQNQREMMEFMRKINVGFGVFRFSWNNAGKIGGIILLIAAIAIFFKAGVAAIISWPFTSKL